VIWANRCYDAALDWIKNVDMSSSRVRVIHGCVWGEHSKRGKSYIRHSWGEMCEGPYGADSKDDDRCFVVDRAMMPHRATIPRGAYYDILGVDRRSGRLRRYTRQAAQKHEQVCTRGYAAGPWELEPCDQNRKPRW